MLCRMTRCGCTITNPRRINQARLPFNLAVRVIRELLNTIRLGEGERHTAGCGMNPLASTQHGQPRNLRDRPIDWLTEQPSD
jgi:hypothetical protein